ncbi:hypothetical protein [Riemerella columbina]|uniref:hypothetical protein n=1 Tax=Riemerella columbina TaxID=103810 RepID=UPI00266EC233|nr:hypothetical protein [Riemerella columbina]WKS94334.1 hypothetical protein NYR17_05120 [Riemerella columbina]
MRKLKFYLIGLIPGCILVFFILNQKGASCSGYLPNSRVITETLSKDFDYTDAFKQKMQQYGISEAVLRDSIIRTGTIDFDQSKAQQEPCPEYLLQQTKGQNKYQIRFEKCKEKALFLEIQPIQ